MEHVQPLAAPPSALPLADPASNPLVARLALRHHLLHPDGRALLSDAGQPADPAGLAAALGLALVGLFTFGAVVAIAAGGGAAGGQLLSGALRLGPAALAAVLLAGLLTFPPLVLTHALRGGRGSLLQLAAAASVGPAICGAWLLAMAPVLLLYGLSGDPGPGFLLLVVALSGMAAAAGGRAAWSRARLAGGVTPGRLVLAGHYLLTAWTALVLLLHLA